MTEFKPELPPAKPPTLEQVSGCLLGLALADAVANLLWGFTPERAAQSADRLVSRWLTDDLPAPEEISITEGTRLSFEIISVYIEHQEFLPDAFAGRLLSGVEESLETHLAAKHRRRGTPWWEAGINSSGCGSIHRAPAIGVMYWGDLSKLRVAAVEQSVVTHRNATASAAAALVAELVASLLNGDCGPEKPLTLALSDDDHNLDAVLGELPSLLQLEPKPALEFVLSKNQPSLGFADAIGQTLLWSLYCCVQSEWDYVDGVQLALRCGGELKAPVALVGAMCGAVQGVDAIPNHLLDRITDRGISGKPEFAEQIRKCYERTIAARKAALAGRN